MDIAHHSIQSTHEDLNEDRVDDPDRHNRSIQDADDESDDLNFEPANRPGKETEYWEQSRLRMPSEIRNIGILINSKRYAARYASLRGGATGGIDQDKSGTYDPKDDRENKRHRKTRAGAHKKKIIPQGFDETDDPAPSKSRLRAGCREIVKISFTSKEGLAYLRSLSPGPYSHHSTQSDLDSESSNSSTHEVLSGKGLRKNRRQRKQNGAAVNRSNGLAIEDLSDGQPQRRGCKKCLELKIDGCSLIDNQNQYPCSTCRDSSEDCELIIPADRRIPCSRCKEQHISCSYLHDDGESTSSCVSCKNARVLFCAPATEGSGSEPDRCADIPVPRRQRNNRCNPVAVAPPRAFIKCNACREKKLSCSVRRREQIGPCKRCRDARTNCEFVSLDAVSKGSTSERINNSRTTSLKPQGDISSNNRQSKRRQSRIKDTHKPTNGNKVPFNGATKQNTRRGRFRKGRRKAINITTKGKQPANLRKIHSGVQHTVIKTCFAHPIKFNYVADAAGKNPCTWCESPFFGLWGHGSRSVEVIPWGGTTGSEEIEGGHAMAGEPTSKMCVQCTLERVRISTCPAHIIREAIPSDSRALIQSEIWKSFSALANGDVTAGELALNLPWCSICASIAEYKCCSDSDMEGCGLRLCVTCADLVEKTQKGRAGQEFEVMDEVIKNWEAAKGWSGIEAELRADAEFLTTEGEMMKRLNRGMGITFGDDEEGNI